MEPGGWKEKRYRGRETLTDRQIQTERGRKSDAKRNRQANACKKVQMEYTDREKLTDEQMQTERRGKNDAKENNDRCRQRMMQRKIHKQMHAGKYRWNTQTHNCTEI